MQPPPQISIRPAEDAAMEAVAAIYAHRVSRGLASFRTEPPDTTDVRCRRAEVGAKRLLSTCSDGTAVDDRRGRGHNAAGSAHDERR